MTEYFRCKDCKTISAGGKLSYDWQPGTLNLLGSCPECGCERFEEVSRICTECEKHEAVKDDDLCQTCIDCEKDALADIELSAIETRTKEKQRNEFSEFLKEIAVSPFRRTG